MPADFSEYLGMPVLVTGGAGFIGSNLVRGLLGAGANVAVLDDLSFGTLKNLEGLDSRLGFITGDVRNADDCRRALQGRQLVFHLAALGSVPASVEMPLKYHDVDATGTLTLLEAARQAGVKRFVYSASSSAYGDSPALPKIETMIPAPKSPYAAAKLTGEYYARVYAEVYGLGTVSLRYFNVFGPRQSPKSQYAAVIPAFIAAMSQGRAVQIYGDGEQTRDFCYVANVVHANMLAGITEATLTGQVVNVGCAQRTSLNDLARLLQNLTQCQAAPIYLEARAGDVKDSLADISAIKNLLGYEPLVYLDEGLAQTVRWFTQSEMR